MSEPCRDCAGDGTIAVHVCRSKKSCARLCPKLDPCMSCLGTGIAGARGPASRTFSALADLYQRFADVGREQHWSAASINGAQAEADRFRAQATKGAA